MSLEEIIIKIGKNQYLSHEENDYLFSLIDVMSSKEQKRIIKDILFKGNKGIVYKELRFYAKDSEYYDLLQEAFVTLLNAIEDYDYKTMKSFYAYTKKCIFFNTIQYLNSKKRLITIPRDFFRKHTDETERENMIKMYDPLSLNQIMEEAEDSHIKLEEILRSKTDIEDEVVSQSIKCLLVKAINHLSEVEQYVLIHRFGLYNTPVLTLQEIADNLKSTVGKIKYIETTAIEKLRNEKEIKFLK